MASQAITPMMAQFLEIKADHPDFLLFYRMGDFYELFFEDAVVAARTLDITLTKRGQHQGAEVPMCGVPVHSHLSYLHRLIAAGHKVAICEQLEDPAEAKKRGSKSVVKRGVTRLVTAGTLTEDGLLEARASNYLAALAKAGDRFGLAWLELSTGAFVTLAVADGGPGLGLSGALAQIEPREILITERLTQDPALFEVLQAVKDRLSLEPDARFDSRNAEKRLLAAFDVGTLDAFGSFSRAEIAAAGALLNYVELTQKGQVPRLDPPRPLGAGTAMEIDAATRRSLELTRTQSGEKKGSLLNAIDRTCSAAGARLLAAHLAMPLTDPAAIENRHAAVAFFVDAPELRERVRKSLEECPDMERALSRLSLDRGGPRDLAAIRETLRVGFSVAAALMEKPELLPLPPAVENARTALLGQEALADLLTRALAPELPLQARDGGFIAPGHSDRLDALRTLRDDSRRHIAALQARYAEQTDIQSLKIRHNNVLGYYVEVTPRHADALMTGAHAETFIHRQTLASAVRFTTTDLADLERQFSEAGDKALAVELDLFAALRADVLALAEPLAALARALAALDVAASHAALAAQWSYTRPRVDDSLAFAIAGGRHPVIEQALAQGEGQPFIANDCALPPDDRLWLLTGPNMAGKSTFLRQNALIALLAQIGSFVPARSAHIGVIDRLFSRVGASDDLARGRSTFMVEMVETAAILHQATERSLVILDEIGRGTATYDGLSIAWAAIEHLHDGNQCRALFATHYHELTALAGSLDALSCHTMKVKEFKGEVVFLHEVEAGAADRSYGIHVARLAGLPRAVIARAEAVLKKLESSKDASPAASLTDTLPLFSAAAPIKTEQAGPLADPLAEALEAIDPDAMTPREALETLYRLKGLKDDEVG